MKLDIRRTYTKWYFYHQLDDMDNFIVYKHRFGRPNWWPKNIGSRGYEETIKLATIHRQIGIHCLTCRVVRYITKIEWNKDAKISFIDRCQVYLFSIEHYMDFIG